MTFVCFSCSSVTWQWYAFWFAHPLESAYSLKSQCSWISWTMAALWRVAWFTNLIRSLLLVRKCFARTCAPVTSIPAFFRLRSRGKWWLISWVRRGSTSAHSWTALLIVHRGPSTIQSSRSWRPTGSVQDSAPMVVTIYSQMCAMECLWMETASTRSWRVSSKMPLPSLWC